jgi:carbon storage regulator CsrA
MNVISRFEGESVIVGDGITVTVLEIEGDQVVLQIDGPDDMQVDLLEELVSEFSARR